MNGQREELFSQTSLFLNNQTSTKDGHIEALFAALRTTMLSGPQSGDLEGYISRVSTLERNARNFSAKAERRRAMIGPLRVDALRRIETLQGFSRNWSTQLRAEEQRLLRLSDAIDVRTRNVTDLRSTLTSALLTAQLLQQQIIAIERLLQTASPEIADSSIRALTISSMPTACAINDEESDGRLCYPNAARVLSALDQLKSGRLDQIDGNIRSALLGLEGYVRAGRGRLQLMADDSAKALDDARAVRQELSTLTDLNASLVRVNRVLLDMKTLLEAPGTSQYQLLLADRQMRSFISQLPFRMSGVGRMTPVLDDYTEEIAITVSAILDDWTDIFDNMKTRFDLLAGFSKVMASLSQEIEQQAAVVRRETTLWVNVYVSNFLIFALLFAACVIGAIWLARQRLIAPLAQVTGTIMDFAKGELDKPFILGERAFGFDRIGQAVEQLRLEMSERQTLMRHNQEQQALIEANLADLERTYKEMEWVALHDPLTGLANRRKADLDLGDLTTNRGPTNPNFCVMQIDIDRFKAVNDALGHAAGDFVLKTVAGILLENAGDDARSYRTGGDEFLVIWPNGLPNDRAKAIANRLISQIKLPIDFDGHRCNVGASIGVAYGGETEGDAMQAVVNADLALYSVKQKGRDGYEFFTNDLASMVSRRKELSDQLLNAIDGQAFQPFYQPQFDAKTRVLRGVEVLCRWHDDMAGWMSPGEFLPLAEELGLISTIDEILFQKVAGDLVALEEGGISIPRVSFNITADRLLKSDLASEISKKVGPNTKIALELLESMSLDNPTESVKWAIDNFKDHGIEIEIDDFGSDRASLAGLMAINPKAMKIDRSIVIPIIESERHKNLVKKILDIGAALNIEVVAEGVETEEHAALLSAYGCDVLQGFGLARPMSCEQLSAFCVAIRPGVVEHSAVG